MRILLAEDDPNISTIAKLTLEQLGGHQVQVAFDGESALKLALSESFDVILLDSMMPKMTGVEVCQAYQQQAENPAPIIFPCIS